MSSQPKISLEDGGDTLAVRAQDGAVIKGQASAGATPAQAAAIASLTDSSGGTAGDTLADVEASYTEATLANNFASLGGKVNSILTALRNAGIIASS